MTESVDQRVHTDGMLSRHLVAPVLVFMYLLYTNVVHKEFQIVIRKCRLIVWTCVLFSSVYMLVAAVRNCSRRMYMKY